MICPLSELQTPNEVSVPVTKEFLLEHFILDPVSDEMEMMQQRVMNMGRSRLGIDLAKVEIFFTIDNWTVAGKSTGVFDEKNPWAGLKHVRCTFDGEVEIKYWLKNKKKGSFKLSKPGMINAYRSVMFNSPNNTLYAPEILDKIKSHVTTGRV